MDAGTAEAWLVTFTTQLRNQLPAGDYIITHARKLFIALFCGLMADTSFCSRGSLVGNPVFVRWQSSRCLQVLSEYLDQRRLFTGQFGGRRSD